MEEEPKCKRCGADTEVTAIHGSTSFFVLCHNCGFNWIQDAKSKNEDKTKSTKQFLRG